MLHQSIDARLNTASLPPSDGVDIRLVRTLKSDRPLVRQSLLSRLAASRLIAGGARSGALKSAAQRSGRPFSLDVRQRVVVKALVCRHQGRGMERAGALRAHVRYLQRDLAGQDGKAAASFNCAGPATMDDLPNAWARDRHHFRFIISPEHGDRISDLEAYTQTVMRRVAEDLGEPDLDWRAVCHFDTDQPHAHVLVRGHRADGRDLVIPRDYIGYGFRARAQEAAQELLGDLSKADAERRIWREVEANRFTSFDRRLLSACDSSQTVLDSLGRRGVWHALTRGRLQHLQRLGLASPVGDRFRLAADLEAQLRSLQTSRDVIRALNQRRLESQTSDIRVLQAKGVRGRLVSKGFHDELGSSPYAFVKDATGVEHYARLRAGVDLPALGSKIEITPSERGLLVTTPRTPGRGLER